MASNSNGSGSGSGASNTMPAPSANSDGSGKGKGRAEQHTSSQSSSSGPAASGNGAGAGGLARSLLGKASIAPGDIASALAQGGKAPFPAGAGSLASSSAARAHLDDLASGSAGAASSDPSSHTAALGPGAGFRAAGDNTATEAEAGAGPAPWGRTHGAPGTYADFARDPYGAFAAGGVEQHDPASRGPFTTAAELDAGLHAHAQALRDSQNTSNGLNGGGHGTDADLEQRWEALRLSDPNGRFEAMQDPAWHQAWASRIPAPTFSTHGGDIYQSGSNVGASRADANANANAQGSQDFMALLDVDELSAGPDPFASNSSTSASATAPASLSTRAPSATLPPGLADTWRPPSPSLPPSLTAEQFSLHRSLAEKQDSEEVRQAEGPPPPDDAEMAEGVHAPTPEEALERIFGNTDARERAETARRRANAQHGEQGRQGEQEVDALRKWLPRGTYVDDVYGLPPLLSQTLRDAQRSPSPSSSPPENTAEDINAHEESDRRARALRRLEALRRHLDSAPAVPAGRPAGVRAGAGGVGVGGARKVDVNEMEAWLRAHPGN